MPQFNQVGYQPDAELPPSLPIHRKCGRACIAKVHWPEYGAQHLGLNPVAVCDCDCGCICRGHRQRPAQSGWLADNTSAATTTQIADGRQAICPPLWLCEYNNCRPPHRYVSSTARGREYLIRLASLETKHWFCEDLNNNGAARCRD